MIMQIVLGILLLLFVIFLFDLKGLRDRFMRTVNPRKQIVKQAYAANMPKENTALASDSEKYSAEVRTLLTDAASTLDRGDHSRAEALYLKAAAADPRCAPAFAKLAMIYLEYEGELGDAEQALLHALKIDSDNGTYLNNLGRVYYLQEKYTDAIRCFEASVRRKETSASRNANLGKAYLAIRQYAKAESSFKKAVKFAPGTAEYRDLLEEALEKKLAHRQLIRR